MKNIRKINKFLKGKKTKTFINQNIKKTNRNNKTNVTLLINNNKKNKMEKSHFNKPTRNILNITEINSLLFKEALLYDKRSFTEYYLSLLKTKHILLYIFYHNDYNSTVIKISIFLFNLATCISVNALFFNDSTMHKIYIDHGSFNIIYQLPKIAYSAIISAFLNIIIRLLGLTESNILKLKKKGNINKYKKTDRNLIPIITIKFVAFFFINFLLLSLFWYYVTCFCGIYRNTQSHLIKDSLFSFITSLITPFLINLLPGFFRIIALKNRKKLLYQFSKLLQ